MTDINEHIRRSGKKSLSVCSLSSHADCGRGAVVADQERRTELPPFPGKGREAAVTAL